MPRPEYENEQGYDDEDQSAREQEQQTARLQALGLGHEREAQNRINLRQNIENRWIEDIRQDCGRYPVDVEDALIKAKTSKVFANLTRPKRQVATSRLSDMLFPTDDKNYGLRPTPIPEMANGDQPAMAQTPEGIKPVANDKGEELTQQQTIEEMAREAAKLMELEIGDQLTEAKYASACRDAIHDACLMGTGIVKGPIIVSRMRKAWTPVNGTDDEGNPITQQKFDYVVENVPSVECVDPFHFFPDPAATNIKESESEYQRHYMSKKQMLELSRRGDFMADQVAEVLRTEPNETPPTYLVELRELSGQRNDSKENRYLVWEYHGPIDKYDLTACGCEDIDTEDPLEMYEGILWIANSIVIKAVVNPMDTEDRPWSVFNYEKDKASIWGYGVPYLCKDPQSALNASYRMMMDNAGLSSGPQIIVNDKIIQPVAVAGKIDWRLSRRKMWKLTDRTRSVRDAFATFDIPSHVGELKEIMLLAKQLFDLETNLTSTTQADQAPLKDAVHQTARGMEMLMNSDNVVMRTAVKNWDDDVTEPLIGRFYDYNMQFNEKPEIKGDYQIDSRGTSALLVKETQARNIFNIANFAGSEPLARLTKWANMYRLMVSTGQIEADEIVKTDEEIAQDSQAEQEKGQADPEADKNSMLYAIHREKLEDNMAERQFKGQLAQMQMDMKILESSQAQEFETEKMAQERMNLILKIQGDRQKIQDEKIIKAQFGSGI